MISPYKKRDSKASHQTCTRAIRAGEQPGAQQLLWGRMLETMAERAAFPRTRAPVKRRLQRAVRLQCRRLVVEVKEVLETTRPRRAPTQPASRLPRKLAIWQFSRSYKSLSFICSRCVVRHGHNVRILST